MNDLNYEELNDKEKDVYDNAYNWGWSSVAESSGDEVNLKNHQPINAEKLFWKYKKIFEFAYEKGVLDYQTYKANQLDI